MRKILALALLFSSQIVYAQGLESVESARVESQPKAAELSRVSILVGGFVEGEVADLAELKVKSYVELRFQKRK